MRFWSLFLLATFAWAPAARADVPEPARRPAWMSSDLESLIVLTETLKAQAAAETAVPDLEPAPLPDLPEDAALMDHIGRDLERMNDAARTRELQVFARRAALAGRPDLFQAVMARHAQGSWGEMSLGMSALNTIAWLPDTARYLSARIALARHPALVDELTDDEHVYLWKDLRVRAERVGDEKIFAALLSGMARTGHVELLLATIAGRYATRIEQYDALITVVEGDPGLARSDMMRLVDELDRLWRLDPDMRRDPAALARLHHQLGDVVRSNALLALEADRILRLRHRFTVLLEGGDTPAPTPLPDPARESDG